MSEEAVTCCVADLLALNTIEVIVCELDHHISATVEKSWRPVTSDGVGGA